MIIRAAHMPTAILTCDAGRVTGPEIEGCLARVTAPSRMTLPAASADCRVAPGDPVSDILAGNGQLDPPAVPAAVIEGCGPQPCRARRCCGVRRCVALASGGSANKIALISDRVPERPWTAYGRPGMTRRLPEEALLGEVMCGWAQRTIDVTGIGGDPGGHDGGAHPRRWQSPQHRGGPSSTSTRGQAGTELRKRSSCLQGCAAR